MGAGTYERAAGGHVAERVRPAAGTPEELELAALVADPATDWYHVPDPEPEPAGPPGRPAQAAVKGDWVVWAVAQGAEPVAAEALTKEALISTYGKAGG